MLNMAKLLLAALVLFALGSVAANPRKMCIDKVKYFLVKKESYGATAFCNALNRDLDGYINKTCHLMAAAKMKEEIVPFLKTALNNVICFPTDRCSMRQKIQCNNVMYQNSGVGSMPSDVNRQMPRFLDRVGPGFADGQGIERYCSMNRPLSFYTTRTQCLQDADDNIYRNCLPKVAPELKGTLKEMFDIAYLNLGPPPPPPCAEMLKAVEDPFCAITQRQRCATTFANAQSATQACLTAFVSKFGGTSFPSSSALCSSLDTLATCMGTAFERCSSIAALFYAPGLDVINKTLAFCTREPPILNGETDQCFYKLNFILITKAVASAAKFCDFVGKDLENYVDRSCTRKAAKKLKGKILPPLKNAFNSVICRPESDQCSIKQKITCNELLYQRSSIGSIPRDVNRQMISFLDKVLVGLADGRSISDFCRSSPPSDYYQRRARCLTDADAQIYSDCLFRNVPEDKKEALKQLFDSGYLNIGPGPAPACAQSLETRTKNVLCKLNCPSGYDTAAKALAKCMRDFVGIFDGMKYPGRMNLCKSAYYLDKCSEGVIAKCPWIGAFFSQGIDYVRNYINPVCNPGASAAGMEYSIVLLVASLLLGKIL